MDIEEIVYKDVDLSRLNQIELSGWRLFVCQWACRFHKGKDFFGQLYNCHLVNKHSANDGKEESQLDATITFVYW